VDRLGVDGDPAGDVGSRQGALVADRAGPAVVAGEGEGDQAAFVRALERLVWPAGQRAVPARQSTVKALGPKVP
jgi:hypothetical protein